MLLHDTRRGFGCCRILRTAFLRFLLVSLARPVIDVGGARDSLLHPAANRALVDGAVVAVRLGCPGDDSASGPFGRVEAARADRLALLVRERGAGEAEDRPAAAHVLLTLAE